MSDNTNNNAEEMLGLYSQNKISDEELFDKGLKFCPEHNELHQLKEFGNDASSKDGKKYICKKAIKEKYYKKSKSEKEIKIIESFFEENYNVLYRAMQLQGITEQKKFIDILLKNLNVPEKYLEIIKDYEDQ